MTRTCDEIRTTYHHVESCQGTVPEAIIAFLEGEDFEDVIRTAALHRLFTACRKNGKGEQKAPSGGFVRSS